jgi:hypothetical protein
MENRSAEILELLRSKNVGLERLTAETRTFLAVPLETLVAEAGAEKNPLTIYEDARAAIIRTLELLDAKIAELVAGVSSAEKSPAFLDSVRTEMLKNERLIVAAFNADDIVFRKIGEAQTQILKLIQENRKSRSILGKFKSAQVPTGEGMDKTL